MSGPPSTGLVGEVCGIYHTIVLSTQSNSTMEEAAPHIAIFPSPGMGHLIPLIELARKLLSLHPRFTVTFIIPDDGSPTKPQKTLLQSIPSVNSIFLPPSLDESLLDNTAIESRIALTVVLSIPALLDILRELNRSAPLSAFVTDIFGAHTFDAVKTLSIPSYLFFTSSAMVLSFCFCLPQLDKSCTCEYRDLPEPVQIPGSALVHGSDLPDPVRDRKTETYRGCLKMCKKFMLADGILVNGFPELEPETYVGFGSNAVPVPPVYPVGPLTRAGSKTGDECLKWLDKQPTGSVLFVSFGSGGTLSRQQLDELEAGLEMSQQRFLLVAKSPSEELRNAAYFECANNDECEIEKEFLERNKEKGFVMSNWAPQVEVLRHAAVGGFMTHCGWNSTMESMVYGVPLIAWPLYAEQRMNAVLLSEVLKVAIKVRENEDGVVERDDVSRSVRRLMVGGEGEELRKRMVALKDAAATALTQDGSSTIALANVVTKWIGE